MNDPKIFKTICKTEEDKLVFLDVDDFEIPPGYNIYFDPIQLTSKIDLVWTRELGGWVLRYNLQT